MDQLPLVASNFAFIFHFNVKSFFPVVQESVKKNRFSSFLLLDRSAFFLKGLSLVLCCFGSFPGPEFLELFPSKDCFFLGFYLGDSYFSSIDVLRFRIVFFNQSSF
jgi:hypothetical protein